jgi:SAM-dependent methyltransferase
VAASGAGPEDTVLDVACGPGILACAFARVTKHVTGIDITPAMLDRARVLQQEKGLTNVTWQLGDVLPLPYKDGAFTLITSRFAFHHFLDPRAVIAEMKRVCAPGGTVLVIDSAPAPDKADAFNRMEKVRDPSHVRALPRAELVGLFAAVGLPAPVITDGSLPFVVEDLIARSFPRAEDVAHIRATYEASADGDTLGLGTHRVGGELRGAYTTAIFATVR